jgi:hypothetical protein
VPWALTPCSGIFGEYDLMYFFPNACKTFNPQAPSKHQHAWARPAAWRWRPTCPPPGACLALHSPPAAHSRPGRSTGSARKACPPRWPRGALRMSRSKLFPD